MGKRRWDGDDRGAGIGSGGALAPGIEALRAQLEAPDWIAEDPHAHLLPHIVRACAAGEDLAVLDTKLESDGVYEVTLDWRPHAASPTLRERVFAVIGAFAESSTHIAQRRRGDDMEYDVVTGMLAHQTQFRTHGHLVRFRIPGSHVPDG